MSIAFHFYLLFGCSSEKEDLDTDGFSVSEGDCDDFDEHIYPNAPEMCDGVDNDCDALIDEHIPLMNEEVVFIDNDQDGYGNEILNNCEDIDATYSSQNGDCNDNNPFIYPTATEICADNIDSDCDGYDGSFLCEQHVLQLSTRISSVDSAPMGSATYAGDINNDGFGDVIVGGIVNDIEYQTGVFFGPFAGLYTTDQANVRISMPENSTAPMNNIVFANEHGDINGDGYDDILISIPNHNNYGDVYLITDMGESQVYRLDNAITISGEQSLSSFGTNLTFLGDVSGDGHDDFVIGARNYGDYNEGAVYLFFHEPNTGSASQADVIFYGDRGDQAGTYFSSLDDGNGDGFREFLLGSYRSENPNNDLLNPGVVRVFDGGEQEYNHMSNARLNIYGNRDRSQMGYFMSGTSDLDGDGLNDILMGSHFYPNPAGDVNYGAAWGIPGNLTGDVSHESTLFQIEGEEGDGLGRTVLSCGDRNQDGYDDIVVSIKYSDYLVENAGSIHIFYGPLSGTYTKNEAHEIISAVEHFPTGIITSCMPSENPDDQYYIFSSSYYDGSDVQSRSYFFPWIR